MAQTREDVRPAPSGERARLCGTKADGVDTRHQELSDTATQVTPTSGGGVGDTDAAAVEHARHPELARHKGGQTETDAETADQETTEPLHQSHRKAERRGGEQDDRQTEARADDIAHRAHDHAADDRPGHRRETGVAELRLGQPEIFTNHGNHRRRRERGHKGDKETDPRHVERHVVRAVKAEDVKLHGFVLAARARKKAPSVVEVSRDVNTQAQDGDRANDDDDDDEWWWCEEITYE